MLRKILFVIYSISGIIYIGSCTPEQEVMSNGTTSSNISANIAWLDKYNYRILKRL